MIVEERTKILADRVIKGLERRNMKGYFCQTVEDANELILSLIPEGDTVSWGGSMTIRDMGLTKLIKESDKYTAMDRDEAESTEEMREIRDRLSFATHSSQAPTPCPTTECLSTSTASATALPPYVTPKQVIVVAGINKVAHSGRSCHSPRPQRGRSDQHTSFPEKVTPCRKTGKCGDCVGEDCICRQILITRMSMIPDRIKVVLINDDLGF